MWPSRVKKQEFQSVLRDARDYALTHGLVLRYPNLANDNSVAHIPFTLLPSTLPKLVYEECCDIQPIVSRLMFEVANDHQFIEETLSNIVHVDEFTRNLLDIDTKVQKEGLAQPIISCINRSDYLLHRFTDQANKVQTTVRQVEVNAIASSMSAHSNNVMKMHQFLLSKYNLNDLSVAGLEVPSNDSLQLVAQGLIDAHKAYDKPDSFILLVAEEWSNNFADQFLIELEVHALRPDVRIVRKRFSDLGHVMKLGPNKELIVDNDKEIAVVYFRYGYDPSNYSDNCWSTRLTLERSRAIKCPSINFHLSGAKKFQQVLNNPKQLERFLSAKDSERLAKIFCNIHSVDVETPEGRAGYELGLTRGKRLVLKPQREGGGHNVFGEDIKPFLEKLNDLERSQYILMELIESPSEPNWLLLQNDHQNDDSGRFDKPDNLISELGIYGSVLGEKNVGIMCNEWAGYLMRSKKDGVNEGGVASGYAGISSLVLYE